MSNCAMYVAYCTRVSCRVDRWGGKGEGGGGGNRNRWARADLLGRLFQDISDIMYTLVSSESD